GAGQGGGPPDLDVVVAQLIVERVLLHPGQALGQGVAGLALDGAVQPGDGVGQGVGVDRPLAVAELPEELGLLPGVGLDQLRAEPGGAGGAGGVGGGAPAGAAAVLLDVVDVDGAEFPLAGVEDAALEGGGQVLGQVGPAQEQQREGGVGGLGEVAAPAAVGV